MSRSLHRIVSGIAVLSVCATEARAQSIAGFPADRWQSLHTREQQMQAVPSRDSLRARMRLLSEDPHEAGTDRSRHVAELILARFRSFGLDAQIERFEALMPRPVSRTLELLGPTKFVAQLREPRIPEDKDSGDPNQLPTYNAYSADGDVTGNLVYVNRGLPEDYKVLDSLGISVKGRIVIARYGGSWRGIKPKVAAEHGAIGCLIYSDPRDDGYFDGDVYPKGPMRPEQGVQRGSVMDMPTHPGDPLSPGWAAEAGSRRLTIAESRTIEPIPVLPISYGDALPLLRDLGGPVAPESWRGALAITYHVGPSASPAHLALKFDWASLPLYDVIARIPGQVWPDQLVIAGNHHDAWVNGAEDPISGMVALEETARGLGQMLRSGWRPARTIIIAAWDGEEWGLLGSTEWAEKHQTELRNGGVLYLNSDTNGPGWLGISGSHSLQAFFREVARDVPDPRGGANALAAIVQRRERQRRAEASATATAINSMRANDSTRTTRTTADSLAAAEAARIRGETVMSQRRDVMSAIDSVRARLGRDTLFTIGALGSGSDYTAFLDFVNMPTANSAFGGEGETGIYHSIYDSYDFYRRFIDTSFVYGVAQSRATGTILTRMADASVLPFDFTEAVRTYRGYVTEIERGAGRNDSTKGLDLSAVRSALDAVQRSADRFSAAQRAVLSLSSAELARRSDKLRAANLAIAKTEQALGDTAGLPGRAWFRHLIYAPGFYTGYGVKTMPGIREAVEDRPDRAVAQREAARVVAGLNRYAVAIDEAARLLEAAK